MKTSIEISVVANGYVVRPVCNQGFISPTGEVYVFNSFLALFEWAEANLKPVGEDARK